MPTSYANPTEHLNPAERQALANAAAPIGPVTATSSELYDLERQATQLKAGIEKANRFYQHNSTVPDSVPDDARSVVVEAAELAVSEVETTTRKDLAIAQARARSIVSQLEVAAAEPSLSTVPDHLLDRANRLKPALASDLDGLPLDAIARRVQAARIRDDEAELLALSMAINPLLTARQSSPDQAGDDDSFQRHELRSTLKTITSRWRDQRLDAALVHAQTVEQALGHLDHEITTGAQERNGITDPYGFLEGLR